MKPLRLQYPSPPSQLVIDSFELGFVPRSREMDPAMASDLKSGYCCQHTKLTVHQSDTFTNLLQPLPKDPSPGEIL